MLLKMENSSKKIHNALQEDLQMVEATSCGGVVIYRGKILTLYKSYKTGMKDGFCQRELWKKERNIMRRLSVR